MNKWQKYYIETFYDGKMPRNKIGKEEFALLGNVKEKVTIHFPKFDSPVPSQCCDAHTETFTVTEEDCNMPKGIISVEVLAANLTLWTSRGHRIDY